MPVNNALNLLVLGMHHFKWLNLLKCWRKHNLKASSVSSSHKHGNYYGFFIVFLLFTQVRKETDMKLRYKIFIYMISELNPAAKHQCQRTGRQQSETQRQHTGFVESWLGSVVCVAGTRVNWELRPLGINNCCCCWPWLPAGCTAYSP